MKCNWMILILWLCCYPYDVHCQSFTDCKSLLNQAYEQMNAMGADVPAGTTYFLDYTVEAKLRQHPNQAAKEETRIYLTADRVMLLSKQMDILSDSEQTFKIIHHSKRVYWTKTSRGIGSTLRMNRAFTLRDSLLEYSEVSVCDQMKDETGRPVRKIILTCTPQGIRTFNYEQVEIWLLEQEKILVRMRFQFGKSGDMEMLDYTFKEINLDYKGDAMPVSFRNYLLHANGFLKGKYKNYQLTDLRKKT